MGQINKFRSTFILIMFFVLLNPVLAMTPKNYDEEYTEYKGIVVDKQTNKPLPFANILIDGTNITTVANSDGEFSVKIPVSENQAIIVISYIGYKNFSSKVSEINWEKSKFALEPVSIELPEVSVISKDADALVEAMLEKTVENYGNSEMFLTAFYRESIKKNRTYVSLSEAVVDIDKQAYERYKSDVVRLYKSRKKTDYNKVDTLVFKLMGGPFNSLYLDIMKHTEMFFTENRTDNYIFNFERSTRQNDKLIYVIDFKQKETVNEPLYYGKLYIDAESLALKSAVFNLNIENKAEAASVFIVKKPFNARVYPVNASYRMDYFEKNGKWYYGYSRIELGLRINWKKKLFNTTYYSTIEMATTNIEKSKSVSQTGVKDKLKQNVIISDEASGFSDPEFWGEYNVIEPEKSIESAIKKIQKQLKKEE